MRDTTRPIKNQDCYSKNFRSILASDARFVRRVRRGNRAEKICGRKVRPMSSRVAQRHAAGSYDSCDSRVSASGRLITLVAALMIALATLFVGIAMPRQASAADGNQTNFDSWTAVAQNIAKQLATAEKKTTMTAITARPAPASRPRIGSAMMRPTSRKSSTTPFPPNASRHCSGSSPIWKDSRTSRARGARSQTESTR